MVRRRARKRWVMRNGLVLDLDDATEFRQALLARPPRAVQWLVGLLVVILGAAVSWAALTEVDLVVRARGRVRPPTPPLKVLSAGRGEVLSASFGGQVVWRDVYEG